MKEIKLTQGYVALVSDKDYKRVSHYKWYAKIRPNTVYAARTVNLKDKNLTQKLHRFILGISDPEVKVDHEDGNGLNCQRGNLRIATVPQNGFNRKLNEDNTSGFKGVSWFQPVSTWTGKWKAQIRVQGKVMHLGYFLNKAEAAKAYDRAALRFHGKFACTNVSLGLLEALA